MAAGLTYVSGLSWETSARRVESALLERLEQVGSRPIDAGTVLARAPALVNRRKASIVIRPTTPAKRSDRFSTC